MRYVYSDAGRSVSKRPKQKSDCVVRAFALVLGCPYDDVYDTFAQQGRKSGVGTPKKIWKNYLKTFGNEFEKLSFPAIAGQKRMNLERFSSEFISGKYLVSMAGHMTCVINGVVYDDFLPNSQMCVYNAWRLK